MKRILTKEDKNILKSSSRIGFVFSLFLFLPSIAAWFLSKFGYIEIIPDLLPPAGVLLSFLILFLVNRKYWIDLSKGEKDILVKSITKKESKEDYEAGSSVGYSTNGKKHAYYSGMSSHMKYYIIVDNVRYRIDKEMWEQVNENDKIEFHIAPGSKELLLIKKH
ncbi:MAG: hypothetical protein R6V23_10015 [Bacteroidales bacterium]